MHSDVGLQHGVVSAQADSDNLVVRLLQVERVLAAYGHRFVSFNFGLSIGSKKIQTCSMNMS